MADFVTSISSSTAQAAVNSPKVSTSSLFTFGKDLPATVFPIYLLYLFIHW